MLNIKNLFIIISLGFYANAGLGEETVKEVCLQAGKISIPASDLPDALIKKELSHCNAVNLYYGIKETQNWNKARQCAFIHKDYTVLTMIYANGKGVVRNWDLAIQFACKAGFAPAEIEGRVKHLIALRDQNSQSKDFDICDDVTSGYMMGLCASQSAQLAQAKRDIEWLKLSHSWSQQDKLALERLQKAASQFFLVRSSNEVDLSGTARAELEIEEQASLQDDLLTSLKDLAMGHLPLYSDNQKSLIDKNLNKIYQQIEKNQEFALGTIDRQSIKKTQLAWLKYQQAWIKFGKIKYPQVDEGSWQAWLAEKRIKMLQDLADSV